MSDQRLIEKIIVRIIDNETNTNTLKLLCDQIKVLIIRDTVKLKKDVYAHWTKAPKIFTVNCKNASVSSANMSYEIQNIRSVRTDADK